MVKCTETKFIISNMERMMKIAAIVPAHNEEASIEAVVDEINKLARLTSLNIDVIVVDHRSTDRTRVLISSLQCISLFLPINLGIGGAVQTGFKYAFSDDYDFAIQIDGDGQHPAVDIPAMLKAQAEHGWDVVIGSRFIYNQGYQSTIARRIRIKYFEVMNRIMTGKRIHDSTSGFRLLNKKALRIVSKYYPDDYPEPEAIVLFRRNGLNIGEVQVTMRERQGGESSINFLSSVYYMLKVSLAIIYTSLRLVSLNARSH